MGRLRSVAVLAVLAVWASLLASASTVAAQQGAGEGSGTYPDTPADSYYAEPVSQLTEQGVFDGTLCADGFCPGEAIDRKTMAVWTIRVLTGDDPPPVTETRFDDVDADGFYAPYIERMAELGVTRGCGDGSGFCPAGTVIRAQMAAFLSRAFNLADGPDPGFSDVPADAWYAADVARLASSGITSGCGDGTVFCPGRDTTRAQMATFLARAAGAAPLPTPPTTSLWVSIGSPAPSVVSGAFDVTIAFTESVAGFTVDDVRVSNGQAVGLSGSGRTYAATIEPAADGTVVVRVPADSARDDRDRGNQASAPLTRVRAPRGGAVERGIDTWDRAAVYRAYLGEFRRTEPDWGYTGDVDDCIAGTTSQQFRDSVFQRLNWYRQMAGLGTVEEGQYSSAGAQHTALMMLAAGRLSHQPDSSWACYSDTGRAYASSNLGLGVAGLDGIDGYMQDPGAQNTEVGHRRWILHPQTLQMGTGNARKAGRSANALWPRDANTFSARPPVREQRGFVAWPPSGYVPPQAAWGRWSFSLAGADFLGASVTMSDDAGPVQTEVVHRSAGHSGRVPEDSTVWAVAGDTDSDPMRVPSDADHCYTVKITGVRANGATLHPYEYSTCLLGKLSRPQPSDHQQPDASAPAGDSDTLPERGFKAVTAGSTVGFGTIGLACGLRNDNTIQCWGDYRFGQLDTSGRTFKAVAAGAEHSCGLRSDNTLTCWGGGKYSASGTHPDGRRWDGGKNGPWFWVPITPHTALRAVAVGDGHTCAIRLDETIACWGNNRFGQSDAPRGSFRAVATGSRHSCGLRSDSTITCWGGTDHGRTDAPAGSFNAVSDTPVGSFKAVTVGDGHSCGLRSDDTITCWGYFGNGIDLDTKAADASTIEPGRRRSCGRQIARAYAWPGGAFEALRSPLAAGQRLRLTTPSPAGAPTVTSRHSDCSGTITCWGAATTPITLPSGAQLRAAQRRHHHLLGTGMATRPVEPSPWRRAQLRAARRHHHLWGKQRPWPNRRPAELQNAGMAFLWAAQRRHHHLLGLQRKRPNRRRSIRRPHRELQSRHRR